MNSSPATLNSKVTKLHEVARQRWGVLYLRLAIGASFLSGIADRFGLYTGRNVGYGNFAGFMRYTAQVNSFMPSSTIPFLAWAATVAELAFGLALVLGIWLRWAALGSSILLVRHCHGNLVRYQVSARLFRVLGFGGSADPCAVWDAKVNACFVRSLCYRLFSGWNEIA